MKKLISCGMFLLLGACSLWSEDAIYLKVKPGLTLSEFNQLGLCPQKIRAQKLVKERSSIGVEILPTAIQNQFFQVKEKSWKGGMVQYQNNVLQKITFFNEKADQASSIETFNKLERELGPNFSFHPFKSFGNNGIYVLGLLVHKFSISVLLKTKRVNGPIALRLIL
jgi:hypothetical protein